MRMTGAYPEGGRATRSPTGSVLALLPGPAPADPPHPGAPPGGACLLDADFPDAIARLLAEAEAEQGFLLARPLPAAELLPFARRHAVLGRSRAAAPN